MPLDKNVLGFENRWCKEGFHHLQAYKIDDSVTVNILPVAYFLASKLEAFKSRGNNEGRTSKDFEDVVLVLDNRANIWEELKQSNESVILHLTEQFKRLLEHSNIEEWIFCHLDPETASERAVEILKQMHYLLAN